MKGSIRIRYAAPPTATSSLAVYDPQGRLLRNLDVVPSASGWREIEWDGRDASGRRVPSGHYWVRLRTPAETRTVQVVRVN
jgi:flagellar hook assembly protein FlgD